jgi:prepilin-type N-terminal cleavage/methylation domain-containing protein
MRPPTHRIARGVTLIELVVSITVIAIAGVALMSTLAYLNGTGNTSILQAQAQSIAAAYLNEITGKSFLDPDGVSGEASRDLYDDVNDYNNLSTAVATDEFGNAAGNFGVSVAVVLDTLGALPPVPVWRVDVTVTYGNAASVVATGYRANY